MAVCQIDTPRLLRPVRVGPDGWQYGEPYQVYTTFAPDLPEWATAIIAAVIEAAGVSTRGTIIGLDKPLTRDEWMAMLEAAVTEGIERVTFERIVAKGVRSGTKRMKTLDVKRTIELLKRDGRTERHEVEG